MYAKEMGGGHGRHWEIVARAKVKRLAPWSCVIEVETVKISEWKRHVFLMDSMWGTAGGKNQG